MNTRPQPASNPAPLPTTQQERGIETARAYGWALVQGLLGRGYNPDLPRVRRMLMEGCFLRDEQVDRNLYRIACRLADGEGPTGPATIRAALISDGYGPSEAKKIVVRLINETSLEPEQVVHYARRLAELYTERLLTEANANGSSAAEIRKIGEMFQHVDVAGDGLEPEPLTSVTDPEAGKIAHIVPGMIPASMVTTVAASWKCGKTLTFYQVVLDCIFGRDVLGANPIPGPIRCAILQLEMPVSEDHRRLRRLAIGMGIDPKEIPEAVKDGRLYHLSQPDLDLTKPEDAKRLHNALVKRGTQLLIIDSLGGAFAGCDLNDNSQVTKLFIGVLGPLIKSGISVIALHHHRKGGTGNSIASEKDAMLGAQAFGARSGRIYSLERVATGETTTPSKHRHFACVLKESGGWSPGEERERYIETFDDQADDDGYTATTVRIMSTPDQIKAGGVTTPQRAAIALCEIVKAADEGGILQDEAIQAAVERVGCKKRSAESGLRQAKKDRWVIGRRDSNRPGAPIVLYPGECAE